MTARSLNAWIDWPTEPGLYLYHYKGTGYFGSTAKRLPLAFDGKALWVCLPEGTRMYGQKAMLFRPKPGAGLFWRIPDAPPIPPPEPALCSGRLVGGASFEVRKRVPYTPPPMMPLMKVESIPGAEVSGEFTCTYQGETVKGKIEVVPKDSIKSIAASPALSAADERHLSSLSGRWGWKRPPEESKSERTHFSADDEDGF